jgi:hypothetical protein
MRAWSHCVSHDVLNCCHARTGSREHSGWVREVECCMPFMMWGWTCIHHDRSGLRAPLILCAHLWVSSRVAARCRLPCVLVLISTLMEHHRLPPPAHMLVPCAPLHLITMYGQSAVIMSHGKPPVPNPGPMVGARSRATMIAIDGGDGPPPWRLDWPLRVGFTPRVAPFAGSGSGMFTSVCCSGNQAQSQL